MYTKLSRHLTRRTRQQIAKGRQLDSRSVQFLTLLVRRYVRRQRVQDRDHASMSPPTDENQTNQTAEYGQLKVDKYNLHGEQHTGTVLV